MKLTELSTRVEDISRYLGFHYDPHVGYLFREYGRIFRQYHGLTGLERPNHVEIHHVVVERLDAAYNAYLESRKHKEHYPPPKITRSDPLVVPNSGQRCMSKFMDVNGVIKQRSRVREGRNNPRKRS